MNWFPGAERSMSMERARAAALFTRMREGPTDFSDVIDTQELNAIWQTTRTRPGKGISEFLDHLSLYPRFFLWKRIWSYDDERLSLERVQRKIDRLHARAFAILTRRGRTG